jgi:hypothetical protein
MSVWQVLAVVGLVLLVLGSAEVQTHWSQLRQELRRHGPFPSGELWSGLETGHFAEWLCKPVSRWILVLVTACGMVGWWLTG